MNGRYKGRAQIFTDASKENNACGIGIYTTYNKKRYSFKLERVTCITTAEIIAIDTALSYIEQDQISNAVLYTDSKSACQIIESGQSSQKLPYLILNIIRKAAAWNIALQWIPSHTNITGNDIADTLAKAGVSETKTISNPVMMKDAFCKFKDDMFQKTNLWYKEYAETKGRTFFQFQPDFEKVPWFYNKNINNEKTRQLNRLITGHDWSKFWKFKMKLIDDENCDTCNVPETAEHIILHCKRFESKNLDHYDEICEFLSETKVDI